MYKHLKNPISAKMNPHMLSVTSSKNMVQVANEYPMPPKNDFKIELIQSKLENWLRYVWNTCYVIQAVTVNGKWQTQGIGENVRQTKLWPKHVNYGPSHAINSKFFVQDNPVEEAIANRSSWNA